MAHSRNNGKNLRVSHSIFTQKFGAVPKYERLVELPTFGHSDNHAGLQLCDIVCSALLNPIACFAYCAGHVNNVRCASQGPVRSTTEGTPAPLLRCRDKPPCGRADGLRRHRSQ